MPELKSRLMDWCDSIVTEGCVDVWIAGGGNFVDEVRNWQMLHGLDEAVAHRISIKLMSQTAEIFHSLFLDWPLLADVDRLHSLDPDISPNVVLDCHQWALHNAALAESWETTSDTISLRLATALRASHLILLKSRTPRTGQINDAIEDGLIDSNFAAGRSKQSQIEVSITNLRQSNEIFRLDW